MPYVHPGRNPESPDNRQGRDAGVRVGGETDKGTPPKAIDVGRMGMLDISAGIFAPEPAAEALARLNRELRAVSTCHQTLMRAKDEQTLLNDICRIVCDEAGYRMAWVGFAEQDEAKSVRPVASAGFDDGYLEFLKITWADTDWGRGAVGAAIRTGRSVCLQNYATDPVCIPWRAEALRRGYLSGIALPLKDESGVVFGTLNMYSPEPNAFTSEEVRLLEELAGDLAFGIMVLRARDERKHIYRRLQSNLRFFECMDQINLAIQEARDLEQMMSQVLGATLSIFGCDRAWLLHPCDPEAATWRVPMERTRPEYPGASAADVEFPMGPENLETVTAALDSPSPVSFDPKSERAVPEGLTAAFGVQSMLCMAIRPMTGKAYMFGLHQCSHPRTWTEDEKTLFEAIGRRLADGLTSLIAYRDLRDREGQLRTLVQTIPDLVWLKDVNGGYLGCNPQFERLVGLAEKDIIGKTVNDLVDKDLAETVPRARPPGDDDRQASSRADVAELRRRRLPRPFRGRQDADARSGGQADRHAQHRPRHHRTRQDGRGTAHRRRRVRGAGRHRHRRRGQADPAGQPRLHRDHRLHHRRRHGDDAGRTAIGPA